MFCIVVFFATDTNKSTTGESSGKETTEPESEEKEEKEELLKESNKERNVKLVIDAQSSGEARAHVHGTRPHVLAYTLIHAACLTLNQNLLSIRPVTRRAATWPLVLELKLFLSNNVRMSTATEMCTARS